MFLTCEWKHEVYTLCQRQLCCSLSTQLTGSGIWADGRKFPEPSGCPTCLHSGAGQSMLPASRASHQQGIPTPLYTKCIQSWPGVRVSGCCVTAHGCARGAHSRSWANRLWDPVSSLWERCLS